TFGVQLIEPKCAITGAIADFQDIFVTNFQSHTLKYRELSMLLSPFAPACMTRNSIPETHRHSSLSDLKQPCKDIQEIFVPLRLRIYFSKRMKRRDSIPSPVTFLHWCQT